MSSITSHAPLGKSDHCVLSFDFHCELEVKSSADSFLYDKVDYNLVRDHVEESGLLKNFIQNKNGKSTQKLWDELKGIIFDIRYQFVPKKTTGKPAWREKGDIPISEEIRHAI